MARRNALTLAAATAALTLAAAAPAQAAPISIGLSTKTSDSDGFAYLSANLSFTDGGRGIDLTGKVTDRCPADSHGAYAIITVHLSGGGFRTWTPQDANGCGGGTPFDHDVNFNVHVKDVSFLLQERDNGTVIRSTSRVVTNG